MFRSLKRTHDLFLANQDQPVLPDEKAYVARLLVRSLDLHFSIRDSISRRVKGKDQYGTVLTLPKGMKPHLKNAPGATDTSEEAPSMLRHSFENPSF